MTATATQCWLRILTKVFNSSDFISPRDILTREVLFLNETFDMNFPVVYHQDRKLNYSFSAADAYFIAHGDNRVANIAPYNKNIAQFSDDGFIFNGAYGPPFNDQLMYAVNTLVNDPNSRQAVIAIWHQNPVMSRDIPCTIALQFLIRNHGMHTKVTMRSSDVWLGIPYDFFNFTIMTLRVLTLYNRRMNDENRSIVTLGKMNWSAGSVHMYEHDKLQVEKVLSSLPDKNTHAVPALAYENWNYVVNSLIACRNKEELSILDNDLWKIRP